MAAKLDFLLCGSPTVAFFSQMAFFKLCLNALGGIYRDARMVCTFGDHDREYLPPEWRGYFDDIEVEWAHPPGAPNPVHQAQHDRRFEIIRRDADLAILCDADIAPLRPFDDLVRELIAEPALAGVIAHFHFPWEGRERNPDIDWPELARAAIGKDIERPYRYTLQSGAAKQAALAPFYVNYGMVAAPPDLLGAFYRRDREIQPAVTARVGQFWGPQVSLPLTCADLGLPTRALPMRYNFPNDPIADRLYPEELESVVFLHFLRPEIFRRAEVFADPSSFEAFVSHEHAGSNEVFRQFVLKITGGEYPFRDALRAGYAAGPERGAA